MEKSKLHPVIDQIVEKIMSDLEDAGSQCMTAVERLQNENLLGALGALAGCEESVRRVRLMLDAAHLYQNRLNKPTPPPTDPKNSVR